MGGGSLIRVSFFSMVFCDFKGFLLQYLCLTITNLLLIVTFKLPSPYQEKGKDSHSFHIYSACRDPDTYSYTSGWFRGCSKWFGGYLAQFRGPVEMGSTTCLPSCFLLPFCIDHESDVVLKRSSSYPLLPEESGIDRLCSWHLTAEALFR